MSDIGTRLKIQGDVGLIGLPPGFKVVSFSEAADEIARLRAALRDARLQIEYLHGKFQATGSGNAVLARIDAALSPPPAEDAPVNAKKTPDA
jgi:hypothetical protein